MKNVINQPFARTPIALLRPRFASGGAVALLLLVSAPLSGQSATAALTGVVQDSSGAIQSTVQITATHATSGFAYTTLTAASGRYWLAGLPPGSYDVMADRIGLRTTRHEGVTLPIGKSMTLDMRLAIAALEVEGVQVVATRALLASTQSDIAFSVDQELIRQLPEESRQFVDLARLVPGVVTAPRNGRSGTIGGGFSSSSGAAVGALNAQSLGIVVDGSDFTEALFGEASGSVPLLAIQEFEVIQTQYSARFGRAASGVINAVTRRGSNETVLEAFSLFRHNSLNALGEFETVKPDFNRRHWGVAYGGPIVRDRTHVFAAFERRVQNDFVPINTQGVFPELDGSVKTPFVDNLLFARLDHRVNDRHELTLRLSGETGEADIMAGGLGTADNATRKTQDMYSALLTHRWSIGDRLLNQAQLHVTNQKLSADPVSSASTTLLYPSFTTGPAIEQYRHDASRIEMNNDLSMVSTGRSGTHRLQLGTQLSLQRNDAEASILEKPACFFGDNADPNPVGCLLVAGGGARNRLEDHRNLQVGFYLQDDWSPNSNLTLNLGLRYDIETAGTNGDYESPFAATVPVFLDKTRAIDKNNIAPRIGLAWDPGADGRTVIRGGFGIFYDPLQIFPLVSLEPYTLRQIIVWFPGTTDPDELQALVDPSTVLPRVWPIGEIKTPMTRQFSLGVERTLPADIVLRVDGLYSQGRNLLIERFLQSPDELTTVRYPEVGIVSQILSGGQANAKLLMFDVRKTFSRGWLSVNYTLANRKNTNDVWQDFVVQEDPDDEDFSGLMSPASWDERHRIVGVGGVDLLAGLSATAKVVYSSARPFSGFSGTDENGDGDPWNDFDEKGRNGHRGPDYFQTDLSLNWSTSLPGGRDVGLMLNIYNALNTTNFDPEFVTVWGDTLGEALAAHAKRQIELGVQVR